MKTKTLAKKLSLTKKTVADLNNMEMLTVKGGTMPTANNTECATVCVTNCAGGGGVCRSYNSLCC